MHPNKDDLKTVIAEAILLELNVAELYLLFYRLFPEDSQFWWQRAIEEKNHAALLKTLSQMKDLHIQVPVDLLAVQLEELKGVNTRLQESLEQMEEQPDRIRAFQMAFDYENSAGELHYEKFIKNLSAGPVSSVFRKLNGDDIDHARRIRIYMGQHQIGPEVPSQGGL